MISSLVFELDVWFTEMMNAAHLQQFPHGGINGSEDVRQQGGNPQLMLQGDGKRKRFWPQKPKKPIADLTLTLEEAAKQVK